MSGPLVTIGVPVFRGESFLPKTLECLRTQSYRHLDIFISVDGSDQASWEACQPFLADPRFRIEMQPNRLGWTGNLNRTIAGRRGEFFVYHQQDDLISPSYVADLVTAAARWPGAALCFSEMKVEINGVDATTVRHRPLLGSPIPRALTHLERMDTSMFRGLIRESALRAARLRTSEFENFSAELPFMAELSLQGEFRFVEGPTYRKVLHGKNTHLRWYDWPEERKRAAWVSLAAWMAEAIVPAGHSPAERLHLLYVVLDRFLMARGGDRWMFCHVDDEDVPLRRAILTATLDRLAAQATFDWTTLLGIPLSVARKQAEDIFTTPV